jgi:uncharacterized protein (TIGR03435 family)
MFRRAAVFLLSALLAVTHAQSFATITIRPARSANQNTRVQVLPNGDLIVSAVPVITLLSYAYGVPSNPSPRLSSAPFWTVHEMYDIGARAAPNTIRENSRDNEAQSRVQQMIRQLLIDRFRLSMRVENKRMSTYALTASRSGPKLQKSGITTNDCVFDTAPDGCHSFVIGLGHPLNAKAVNMGDLAHYIENWPDLPVGNRTALSGLYTINTQGWAPMRLPPPPPHAAPEANPFAGLPAVFTVLGKLGLELKREDAILPVYTVERIERPTTK